jgi:ribosomal protein S15P/S13E
MSNLELKDIARADNDTGSPESQIFFLTKKIVLVMQLLGVKRS